MNYMSVLQHTRLIIFLWIAVKLLRSKISVKKIVFGNKEPHSRNTASSGHQTKEMCGTIMSNQTSHIKPPTDAEIMTTDKRETALERTV